MLVCSCSCSRALVLVLSCPRARALVLVSCSYAFVAENSSGTASYSSVDDDSLLYKLPTTLWQPLVFFVCLLLLLLLPCHVVHRPSSLCRTVLPCLPVLYAVLFSVPCSKGLCLRGMRRRRRFKNKACKCPKKCDYTLRHNAHT